MRQIGNYIAEDTPLGTGGMGRVLRGKSAVDGRPVALKEILPEYVADLEFRSRVEGEISFLKTLHHPNVVKVYDSFEAGSNMYIVMELVEGLNIEQRVLTYGPIPWQEAVEYMKVILSTMQYVHEHGIVHRDIKPSNIMILPDGGVRLLDFGVAKDVSERNQYGTVIGTIIGTDGYMSPEQAQGMSIDNRSDIYSLGCVFFYMLTGTHAYTKKGSNYQMSHDIIYNAFPRVCDRINVPSFLDEVISGAVEKNMMKRYATCRDFLHRLNSVGTSVRSGNSISISIGRQNCDMTVGMYNANVSRHHLDVMLKQFTGGEYFVFSDCSSNGTYYNGRKYSQGETFQVKRGVVAEIFLAGEPEARVTTPDIDRAICEKAKKMAASASVNSSESLHGVQSGPAGRSGFGGKNSVSPAQNGGNPKSKNSPQWSVNSRDNRANMQGPGASKGGEPFVAIPDGNMENPGMRNKSKITFGEAVKTCFNKACVFSGRASRAEYWWFALFNFIVGTVILGLEFASLYANDVPQIVLYMGIGYAIYVLAMLLPTLAVTIRRLHDTGHGWGIYLLSMLIPFLGILLFIYLVSKGTPGPNEYGPAPGAEFYQS